MSLNFSVIRRMDPNGGTGSAFGQSQTRSKGEYYPPPTLHTSRMRSGLIRLVVVLAVHIGVQLLVVLGLRPDVQR